MSDTPNLEPISHQIWAMYPETRGVYPEIRPSSGSSSKSPAYTLTYHTQVAIQGGRLLSRWVKVSISTAGKILKITSSK